MKKKVFFDTFSENMPPEGVKKYPPTQKYPPPGRKLWDFPN